VLQITHYAWNALPMTSQQRRNHQTNNATQQQILHIDSAVIEAQRVGVFGSGVAKATDN
jgi:hypothetical protein